MEVNIEVLNTVDVLYATSVSVWKVVAVNVKKFVWVRTTVVLI